jgi:pleckstrin homology domain-containing family A member 1/2
MDSWVQAVREAHELLKNTATLTGLEASSTSIPVQPADTAVEEETTTQPIQIGRRPRQGSSGSTGPPTVLSPSAGPPLSSSPLSRRSKSPGYITSSDDDEFFASPLSNHTKNGGPPGSPMAATHTGVANLNAPPTMHHAANQNGPALVTKDPTKVVLSGYLMKCGQKRRNWRKRWFVLTGEKLVYYANHMVSSTSGQHVEF